MLYDGMRFNMMVVNGGGASKHFFVNQADAQEVVLEVAGMSAEGRNQRRARQYRAEDGRKHLQGVLRDDRQHRRDAAVESE
jgi:uncharacterized membrane protein